MVQKIKFLGIRLRAFAQATEVEDRVLRAMAFASGTEDISQARSENYFGSPMVIFEAELDRAKAMTAFINRLEGAGILASLAPEIEARTDDECAFHFRLDKQKAFLGELCLATNKDVIDVRMKVGAYPARRDEAVRLLSEWLAMP